MTINFIKWPQWNNIYNEFHFGVYNVNDYKRLTEHRIKNIAFHPKWNLMSTPLGTASQNKSFVQH